MAEVNINMGRIYAPVGEDGNRDVLYPETNSESVVSRWDSDNNPISLKDDIGPKIIFGTVSDKDKTANSGREVLQCKTIKDLGEDLTIPTT